MMLNVQLAVLLSIVCSAYAWRVSLTSNAPVVIGGTVQFRAQITDDRGHAQSGNYQFRFRDNAIPQHSKTIDGGFTSTSWDVTYDKDEYSPGSYEVQVEIYRWTLFYWNVGSKRIDFDLTALLNGGMNMTQYNKTVTEDFVSSASEVTHSIYFSKPDQEFLTKNATSVVAYWFVSCIYYGATSDLTFKYNYTNDADQTKHVEALVVASFDPLPPPTTPAPTTTTAAPTDKPPTTAAPTTIAPTTTVKPSNNITAVVQPNLKLGTNVSEIPILPYVCLNTSIIPPDPKKTYGYFATKVDVKAPVSSVNVIGNNWLQHGDILNLSVSCNGSAPFLYCFQVMVGEYNVTGNETCSHETLITDCQLTLPRYIHYPGTYTVVIIISNSVSRKVTPVGVNIYEVKKHPQLSVIVVPVVCSGIAVILIIFGAAYYKQSRHRYTIEVADFDFAQVNDMEYMTFGQRLKSALNNYMNRPDQNCEFDPLSKIQNSSKLSGDKVLKCLDKDTQTPTRKESKKRLDKKESSDEMLSKKESSDERHDKKESSDEKQDKGNLSLDGESAKEILDVRSLSKLDENSRKSTADYNSDDSDSNISSNTTSTVTLESTNAHSEGNNYCRLGNSQGRY